MVISQLSFKPSIGVSMCEAILTLILFMALQGQMIHGGQIDDMQCPIGGYRGSGPRNHITLNTSNIEDSLQNKEDCRFEPHTPIDAHTFDLAPIQGITFLPLPSQSGLPGGWSLYPTKFVDVPSVTTSLYSLKESLRI
jgi:hypothetical protein